MRSGGEARAREQRWRCALKGSGRFRAVTKAAVHSTGVVLLAGGQGKRMLTETPKQYLHLSGLPMALRSAHTLSSVPSVSHMCIVCDEAWQSVFNQPSNGHVNGLADAASAFHSLLQCGHIVFAPPGDERQHSVENGFNSLIAAFPTVELVAIHDGARPLVRTDCVARALEDAFHTGASALASPCKATIKRADKNSGLVLETLDRSELWEMHTPQIARVDVLQRALQHANDTGLLATDDAALVEAADMPVKVTHDAYDNIKITTPDDMPLAERALQAQHAEAPETV